MIENLIHNDSRNASQIQTLLVVLDQTISLLTLIFKEASEDDQQQWELLASCFETHKNLHQHTLGLSLRPTNVTSLICSISQTGRPGRPSFIIHPGMLEDLLELGFSKQQIARLLGVFRWTQEMLH